MLTNVQALRCLSEEVCQETGGLCDRTREPHLSWDPVVSNGGDAVQYKTECEAEYPDMMCEKMAKLFLEELNARRETLGNPELDFSEIFSGPRFPLTKAMQLLGQESQKVVLVDN